MYEFIGKVVKGEGRGRQLGWPTANLDNVSLSLNYGVYQVEVALDNKSFQGLMHFGPKKTFNNLISAEVYIKDFNQDIYGRQLKITVIKKIRSIIKFESVEALIRQMEQDKLSLN